MCQWDQAAVGGSHIIASTQAGAIYSWQLALIIILVHLFKYPFSRFGVQYTLGSGNTLLEGYQQKGRAYLWVFLRFGFWQLTSVRGWLHSMTLIGVITFFIGSRLVFEPSEDVGLGLALFIFIFLPTDNTNQTRWSGSPV